MATQDADGVKLKADYEKSYAVSGVMANQHNATNTEQRSAEDAPWWSTANAMTVSSIVLLFGLSSLIIAAMLMKRTQVTTDGILKVFGMVLLIFSAVFLVVAGYTERQIGPVLGLLGTIAGFIFGRMQSPSAASAGTAAPEQKKD